MAGKSAFTSRTVAFAIDWVIIAVWGSVLFGIVWSISAGNPPRPSGPWQAQFLGLVTLTIPFALYFACLESSRWTASIGKRVTGLVVLDVSGQPLSFWRSLTRNLIKFLPWELGHLVAWQANYAGGSAFPAWLWGPFSVATVAPVWWLATLFLTSETPYDRWTNSIVVSKADWLHKSIERT